jgi:hypothetical protein
MSVDNVRHEVNLLSAFTLTIVVAFADGACYYLDLLLTFVAGNATSGNPRSGLDLSPS